MSLYPPPQPQTYQLLSAELRQIQATHYADESSPHWDAEREYSAEQVALAARALTRAVDALPEDQRPIGWDTGQSTDLSTETEDDRRILRAAPADSDDWDDATWAAWARVADRAHSKLPKPESDR